MQSKNVSVGQAWTQACKVEPVQEELGLGAGAGGPEGDGDGEGESAAVPDVTQPPHPSSRDAPTALLSQHSWLA